MTAMNEPIVVNAQRGFDLRWLSDLVAARGVKAVMSTPIALASEGSDRGDSDFADGARPCGGLDRFD